MKKIIIKLFAIILIQIIWLGNFAWAGNADFCRQNKDTLSPQIYIDQSKIQRVVLLYLLYANDLNMSKTTKDTGMTFRELEKIIGKKEIRDARKMKYLKLKKQMIIALINNGGNVKKATDELGIGDKLIYKYITKNTLDWIRKRIKIKKLQNFAKQSKPDFIAEEFDLVFKIIEIVIQHQAAYLTGGLIRDLKPLNYRQISDQITGSSFGQISVVMSKLKDLGITSLAYEGKEYDLDILIPGRNYGYVQARDIFYDYFETEFKVQLKKRFELSINKDDIKKYLLKIFRTKKTKKGRIISKEERRIKTQLQTLLIKDQKKYLKSSRIEALEPLTTRYIMKKIGISRSNAESILSLFRKNKTQINYKGKPYPISVLIPGKDYRSIVSQLMISEYLKGEFREQLETRTGRLVRESTVTRYFDRFIQEKIINHSYEVILLNKKFKKTSLSVEKLKINLVERAI
ncbi:MAG: hypothetical protein ABIG64_10245 [Candidatus Omnitrophota bacterium]